MEFAINGKIDMKKVLVVDDHPICRRGIIRLLSGEPDLNVCEEAESTDQALERVQQDKPDIVILDLSLKNSSGIDFIKFTKSRYENMKVIVVSMHDETILVERAIRAGARAYVMKREAADNLITAVRNVLEGKFYLSESTKEKALQSQFAAKFHEDPMASLSDRELEVFQLIGQGLTTADIAKNLHLSIKTVEGYRANIRVKLNLKDNMALIRQSVKWAQCGEAA